MNSLPRVPHMRSETHNGKFHCIESLYRLAWHILHRVWNGCFLFLVGACDPLLDPTSPWLCQRLHLRQWDDSDSPLLVLFCTVCMYVLAAFLGSFMDFVDILHRWLRKNRQLYVISLVETLHVRTCVSVHVHLCVAHVHSAVSFCSLSGRVWYESHTAQHTKWM